MTGYVIIEIDIFDNQVSKRQKDCGIPQNIPMQD